MRKTCTKCSLDKDVDEFYPERDGWQSRCKECSKRLNGEYSKTERGRSAIRARYATYEGRKRRMWESAKYRATRKGIAFTITRDDFEIPEFCPILGIKLASNPNGHGPSTSSATLDRIDPALGYVPGNVQVISYRANSMKYDARPQELLVFAEWILKTFKGPG